MTSRLGINLTCSAEALLSPTARHSARSAIQEKAKPSLSTYDNNGNVIGYWHEEGDLVAEYAYDAFGNTIYEDGDMADFFPHRFSTKYYDSETDLYYYGYRYYSPALGRLGTREAFVSKVRREKESFYKLLTASDFSSIIRQIESSISDITEPYDRIGIVAHGGWNKKLNRPDGNVWMKDDTGALVASPRESLRYGE